MGEVVVLGSAVEGVNMGSVKGVETFPFKTSVMVVCNKFPIHVNGGFNPISSGATYSAIRQLLLHLTKYGNAFE